MTTFVDTRAIQVAAKGREIDVLDELRIPWRDGRLHIRCPYPAHDDASPSWRWDEGGRKAYCTCLSKPHSIFDLVMVLESRDFGSAKIRIAGLLGRTDLIKTSGGGRKPGPMDAVSLLNPDPANRDDALPITYLAHRLRVPNNSVPIPRTPVVGLKRLEYFEPTSPGSKVRASSIGAFPCAIFGTVGPGGQRHAHRVYLAPGGTGKAELGTGWNGQPREAKKSATVQKGLNVSGLSVIWGDPERAPWVILTEGIETGAAIALAFGAEISVGTAAIAAAVSAAGVQAFQPYPATKRITVGADRDEGAKAGGKPASRRGERAARTFALKNREQIEVTIALPGADGETVDWLDIFLRDGSDQVRGGILSATPPVPSPDEPYEVELTEHSIALGFARRNAQKLRYCHTVGGWYIWTGTHWSRDETRHAFTMARHFVADANRDAGFGIRRTTGKAAFTSAVERFAQADQSLALAADSWNRNPWLLATPNGTIELITGTLRKACQSDHISRITAVAPAETVICPAWLEFLAQATGGDQAVTDFLRRWFGYCLTGNTREHALLFVYGPGGNGKGVLLQTIAGIFGDYAAVAAMDTFVTSHNDRHPTDLAMLHGARMVITTETEEDRAWAETRIKSLTGGDPISARFMRQDFFTFTPAFKLTISGNHKPALRTVDDAARRRFNVVPFLNKPACPDPNLVEALKGEWPGILRWMIEGCLAWQREGLARPKAVLDATGDYFAEQDVFAQWIDECCECDKSYGDKSSRLFASWRNFADGRGEESRNAKWFATMLDRQNFRRDKDCDLFRGRGFRGIRVTPEAPGRHWQDIDN